MSCAVYVESRQPLLRSLKQVLEPAFEVVAMADNVLSLVDAISSLAPGLVVMDMCGQSSEGGLPRHVRHRFPDPAMVLLVDEADALTVRIARTWGVQGVVDRARVAEDLCAVAQRALKRRETARQRASSRAGRGEGQDEARKPRGPRRHASRTDRPS